MPVVRHADSRRTETPGGVMTTLASPTQGGADRPVWRVDMQHGQEGPAHVIDTEQVWTVLVGAAAVDVDGENCTLTAGDTIVLRGGVVRTVRAAADDGVVAIVAGAAGARASVVDGPDLGVPPWMM